MLALLAAGRCHKAVDGIRCQLNPVRRRRGALSTSMTRSCRWTQRSIPVNEGAAVRVHQRQVHSATVDGFWIGNVWEWTSDWYVERRAAAPGPPCCVPGGMEESYDLGQPQFRIPRKVIKGGSYLCADSYCLRYRPAARRPQMIDTGMSHIGMRCVVRAPESS
jgi:Sulfatase-modifying factor enzyme 1